MSLRPTNLVTKGFDHDPLAGDWFAACLFGVVVGLLGMVVLSSGWCRLGCLVMAAASALASWSTWRRYAK